MNSVKKMQNQNQLKRGALESRSSPAPKSSSNNFPSSPQSYIIDPTNRSWSSKYLCSSIIPISSPPLSPASLPPEYPSSHRLSRSTSSSSESPAIFPRRRRQRRRQSSAAQRRGKAAQRKGRRIGEQRRRTT